MNSRSFSFALMLLFASGLPACQTSNPSTGPDVQSGQHPEIETLAPADVDVSSLSMFNGLSGTAMTWDQLVDAASQADVVIIGETHGHPLGLPVAARLFDELIKRRPATALSMEFFERDRQVALDDYLNGITDEEQFEEAAHRTPGNYPPGHRAMIEAAKAAGRPVIAANAPRRYVSLARTDGFERLRNLTPDQDRLVDVPDAITTGRYQEDFFALMKSHGADGSQADADKDADADETPVEPPPPGLRLEDMFRSQNVWDATMAQSIAVAADKGLAPIVHVVGRFHCDFSGGTVSRLAQLRPELLVWTISMVNEESEALNDDDKGRADCVIYVGPEGEDEE